MWNEITFRLAGVERRNLLVYGYGAKGFTLSMLETAIELSGGNAPAGVLGEILASGRELMTHPIEPLPGVHEALEQLAQRAPLVLITKGDLFHQESKLAASGLGDFFAGIEIAGPWVLLGSAETRLPSSTTGLLVAAVPMAGLAIAFATGRAERLAPLAWLGLALGIDYCLFVISRVREERTRGADTVESIERAGATASRAVLFSGSAFVLAMLGLLLVPSTIMRSLATGAILVGIVTVAAALTLLPALLRVLGDRINAARVPYIGRRVERGGDLRVSRRGVALIPDFVTLAARRVGVDVDFFGHQFTSSMERIRGAVAFGFAVGVAGAGAFALRGAGFDAAAGMVTR